VSNIVEMPSTFEHISAPLQRVLLDVRAKMDARIAAQSKGNPKRLAALAADALKRFDETGDVTALAHFEIAAQRQQTAAE
jgi:hypothetical protein